MKKSKIPTPYILIKAYTDSEWDKCNFAIFHITDEWKSNMENRVKLLKPLLDTKDFYSMAFMDVVVGYFKFRITGRSKVSSKLNAASVFTNDEDWCYVDANPNMIKVLTRTLSQQHAHKFVLLTDNSGYYTSTGNHNGEEFWTEDFKLSTFIDGL
ncbi:hypothetical protein ACVWYN_003009 [Pedobacter sp. UYP24]